MADRFYDQAAKQVNPIYQQQTAVLQGQIPELQNYYNQISQGLQQQNQQQLAAGVNNIVEDANARGVLRSTLPVDARQALTAQLGAALNQSLGEIGHQQAQDIGNLQSQIGQLGLQRLNSIQDISQALYNRDLQERQFKFDQRKAQQDYQLRLKELAAQQAARASADAGPTINQFIGDLLANGFTGENRTNGWTENYAAGVVANAYGISKSEALKRIYKLRKNYEG